MCRYHNLLDLGSYINNGDYLFQLEVAFATRSNATDSVSDKFSSKALSEKNIRNNLVFRTCVHVNLYQMGSYWRTNSNFSRLKRSSPPSVELYLRVRLPFLPPNRIRLAVRKQGSKLTRRSWCRIAWFNPVSTWYR